MTTRLNPQARALLDGFLARFEEAILERIAPALQRVGSTGARMCPAPDCHRPGAGPRNRFFCREHARSLSKAVQDRLLAQARRDAPREPSSARAGRLSARRKPRGPLDMSCRVESCKNKSRGPRYGFICDEHIKTLGKKQQQEAREKYKARRAAAAAKA